MTVLNKLIAILTIISTSGMCFAQSIAQKSRNASIPVNMSCVRRSAGGAKNITWKTNYGSGERDINRSLTYETTIRWSGRTATNAVLDVWFVGTPARGGEDLILDNKTVDLVLHPSSNCVTRVTSDEINHRKTDYVALGIKEREGFRLRGCVIQLIMEGEVVRSYSPLGHLQREMWNTPFGSITTGEIGDPEQ